MQHSVWQTPLGPLHALWTEKELAALHLGSEGVHERWQAWLRRYAPDRVCQPGPAPGTWDQAITSYFAGERVSWPRELDQRGTDFRKRVWEGLRAIPYGEVWTYARLAEHIGQPGASRAVGGAVGANPCPLVVPCHRVVARRGLGGFSGPMAWKVGLLALEGACLPGAESADFGTSQHKLF